MLREMVLSTDWPMRTRDHGLGGNSMMPAAGRRPPELMMNEFPASVRYSLKEISPAPPLDVPKSTEIWFPAALAHQRIQGRSGDKLNAELT